MDCAGGREFHHCFGAGGGAGGAISSSAGRDAGLCTGGEFTKVRGLLVGRLILPSCRLSLLGRLRLRSLRGCGVKWGLQRLEMRMKCPWSSRKSMFPLSCAFLANARV